MKGESFHSLVHDGRLRPEVSRRIADAIKRAEGTEVTVTVGPRQKVRGNQANRYYWGVVVAAITDMFRDAGNTVDAEDVHNYLKQHVGKLKQVLVTQDGEVLYTLGSTADLTTREFSDYLEKVKVWAAEMGCQIPEPDVYHNHP